MADYPKSLGESSVQSLGHVSLLWWLLFDVMGGLSTAILWGLSHPFWAGVTVSATGIATFLTFLEKHNKMGKFRFKGWATYHQNGNALRSCSLCQTPGKPKLTTRKSESYIVAYFVTN